MERASAHTLELINQLGEFGHQLSLKLKNRFAQNLPSLVAKRESQI